MSVFAYFVAADYPNLTIPTASSSCIYNASLTRN